MLELLFYIAVVFAIIFYGVIFYIGLQVYMKLIRSFVRLIEQEEKTNG